MSGTHRGTASGPAGWQGLDAVPPSEREDAWRAILSAGLLPMDVRLPEGRSASFRGRLRRQWLADLALVECFSDPFSGCRTAAHLAADDDEVIAVLVDVSGQEYVAQRDEVVQLRPGRGVALAPGTGLRFEVTAPYRKRCLVVPVRALEEITGWVPRRACIELGSASPAVALLDGYLGTLARTLPGMSGSARVAARNAALQLVAGALEPDDEAGAGTDAAAAAPALRASMDSWIDRRLLDPDISAAAMAADHAVSVRTVHRLLSKEGDTFSAVVRRRRLDRAREELADGDRAITVIAARWGFADASHFSRSFKDAFGISPREYRAGRAARHGSLLVDG